MSTAQEWSTSNRAKARSLLALGAALALTAAGGAVVASPANAAASERLYYTCSSPDLGTFTASAIHRVTANDQVRRTSGTEARPVNVVYGGWVKVSTTLLVPAATVRTLRSQYVDALDGSGTTAVNLAGVTLGAEQGIDKTPVPSSGAMKLVVDGYMGIEPAGVDAGRTAALHIADVAGSDFTAELFSWTGGSRSDSASPLSCELVNKQDRDLGSVAVAPAQVDSRSSITYDNATGKVVSKVGVWAVDSSARPEGTIRLILKRNGQRIDSSTRVLRKGFAVMRTTAPAGVEYQLIAKYDGAPNFGSLVSSSTQTP